MEDLYSSLGPLDFTEALKDSPRFRWSLNQHESYLTLFESKLKDVMKQCQHMVEHGKAYIGSFHSMLEAVADMNGTCFKGDSDVFSAFETLSTALEEVLNEQAYWTIARNINDFIKRELNKVHEMRIHFLRVGQSLDDALMKNAQISKHKEQESFESRNELTAVGTCFAHTALDYVFQINIVQSRKKYEILEALFAFLRAYQTFFHQGSELLTGEWSHAQETLNETVDTLKQNSKQVERKMQDRHMLVPREIFQHPTGMPLDPDVVMEGYLFKRASNAFKTWNRRWFAIRDNRLLYCHRDIDSASHHDKNFMTEDGFTVMEVDLRLCLVRAAPNNVERRHCFELVTPTKNHLLQADSESLCNAWIKALQRSIESALHDSSLRERELDDRYVDQESHSIPGDNAEIISGSASDRVVTTSGGVVLSGAPPLRTSVSSSSSASNSATPPKKRHVLGEILRIPGNDVCADCGAPDPRWASINLGVTLCIECCASHRSLGVQVSKVRSLTLDAWEPEQVKLMTKLGNRMINDTYLAHLEPSTTVPLPAKPNCSRAARDAWIKAKYLDRQFAFAGPRRPRKKRRDAAAMNQIVDNISPLVRPQLRDVGAPSVVTSGQAKRPPNFRSTRAKSMAQESHTPSSLGGTDLQPSVRQSGSTPDLHIYPLEGPDEVLSSSYGSESMLNQPTNTNTVENLKSRVEESRRLLAAARLADLRGMSEALARNADINFADSNDPDHTSALHATILSGSVEACEYLLLNGAKINIQDSQGRTPLHLSCQLGNVAHVCLLLKRGASQELSTVSGETALDISMDLTNADIVTLLRLAKLNEEIKETEYGNGGDDTFVEVVRDISLMASNRPHMLKRTQQSQGSLDPT